jgi:methoxymalonate biosynthesis acyl carrier protein
MTDRTIIEQKIKNYLQFDCSIDISKIDCDTSLFKSSILDSIDIIKMVVFIEKSFNVRVDVFEIGLDSFESINAITNYVENKLTIQV